MFDLLRKKISGFTHKILGSAREETSSQTVQTESLQTNSQTLQTNAQPAPTISTEKKTESAGQFIPDEKKGEVNANKIKSNEIKIEEITRDAESENNPKDEMTPAKTMHESPAEKSFPELPAIAQREDREIKTKIGIFQKIGGMLTGTITLNENTINTFLDEFEFSLLEADVEISTAQALVEELRSRLSNKVISSNENPAQVILHEIKQALQEIIDVKPFDLEQTLEGKHPGIILILGPNGAGKTTTIAKLTHYFQQQHQKIVLASADTFRAGSIEQLAIHAEKLKVRLVKHQYGADPAAVAFDAVNAAKADGADIVLIDTAGRQDTNKNLLEELKKIQRVIQPHVKIYVGESYTGQAILTQARTFDEAIGIDGFILTKLDTDAKGGGVISILHNVKKPILFFGTGQEYGDLIPFHLEEFLERLIPEKE